MENNGKSNFFKEEIKFIIIITAFIASVLFNWFSTKSDISLIQYRVNKIEIARAEIWIKQDIINQKQTEMLNNIQSSLVELLKRK